MANYPIGISLPTKYLIVEFSETTTSPNTSNAGVLAGGYVRQIGAIVVNAKVDDYVQFSSKVGIGFIQSGINYKLIQDDDIFFVQNFSILP